MVRLRWEGGGESGMEQWLLPPESIPDDIVGFTGGKICIPNGRPGFPDSGVPTAVPKGSRVGAGKFHGDWPSPRRRAEDHFFQVVVEKIAHPGLGRLYAKRNGSSKPDLRLLFAE